MLRTVSQTTLRQVVFTFKLGSKNIGRFNVGIPKNTAFFIRPFSTEIADKTEEKKSVLDTDKGYTPDGAAFTNPNIDSEWVYREEKDTKRKYYINTKTNEILYNRTPDSKIAGRWRRLAAGCIDFSLALFGGVTVSTLAAWELGDQNLGFVVGRIYLAIFYAAKDCILDHGTRGLGKKLMKLEIVNKHGELSGPYRNFFRNPFELCMSFSLFLGFPVFMMGNMLVGMDALFFLIFKKRLFDFALGTRVINESEDHAMRVKLHKDKISYKRQAETLEEASMSGMQQMIEQQKKYDANMQLLEEQRKREKAEAAAAAAKKEIK